MDKIFDRELNQPPQTTPAASPPVHGTGSNNGSATQPPVFQLKGSEKETPKPATKAAVVDVIKTEYNSALKANKDNKEKAFDHLAQFIASKTQGRRFTSKKKGTSYGFAPGSMKISGDKDAMTYLHKIGYWKDKPRRIQKAALELYEKFSVEKDADGNRTKALDESSAKDKIKDLVNVTRPDDDQRAIEQAQLDKEQDAKKVKKKDRKSIVGNLDSTADAGAKNKYAWSASTISKIHHLAGSGDTFQYADGHVIYARATKKNIKKDNIEGLEKLHKAFGKGKAKVGIGDTLHKGRKNKKKPSEKSSYKSIKSKTHSDVVIGIEVYVRGDIIKKKGKKRRRGKMKKAGSYEDMMNNYKTEVRDRPKLSLKKYVRENGFKIYAVVIGGNTSDYSAPDKRVAKVDTLGKNYVPLNYDKTISKSRSRGVKAYFGIQKTDF